MADRYAALVWDDLYLLGCCLAIAYIRAYGWIGRSDGFRPVFLRAIHFYQPSITLVVNLQLSSSTRTDSLS